MRSEITDAKAEITDTKAEKREALREEWRSFQESEKNARKTTATPPDEPALGGANSAGLTQAPASGEIEEPGNDGDIMRAFASECAAINTTFSVLLANAKPHERRATVTGARRHWQPPRSSATSSSASGVARGR